IAFNLTFLIFYKSIETIFCIQVILHIVGISFLIASLINIATFVNLKVSHFYAVTSTLFLLIFLFAIDDVFDKLAILTFSGLEDMINGFILSIVIFIITTILLKYSLRNIEV
ncbi:hypothetical protein D7X33_40825, partial [Butyricicoccus sp. 1XD8-22]